MKRIMKRLLAGWLALALVVTGNAFPVTTLAAEIGQTAEAETVAEDMSVGTEDVLVESEGVTDEPEEAEAVSEDAADEEAYTADDDEPATLQVAEDGDEIDPDDTEYLHVYYVAEEGDVTGLPVDDTDYQSGDSVTIAMEQPSREGYSFMGWSPTGNPVEQYTGGYTITITEDLILTAVWNMLETEEPEEDPDGNERLTLTPHEQSIIEAIDTYVDSLGGVFPNSYKGVAWQCCAFTLYVWANIYGKSWKEDPNMCRQYTSNRTLENHEIYQFLREHDAQAGDILWCHYPYSAKKYQLTHNMIILEYDETSITLTDGYEKNGQGVVDANHKKVKYTDAYRNKFFNGSCYISLYHVTDASLIGAPEPPVYNGKCGDNLTWTLTPNSNGSRYYTVTISGTGAMYDYAKDEYDTSGKALPPWTLNMKSHNYYNNSYASISRVVINSGLTKIGSCAFAGLGDNVDCIISIPATVTEIGESAFAYSGFSGSPTIPNSVTKIGKRAFMSTKITSVTFGSGLTEIPDYCFCDCERLNGTITIPGNITKIGEDAFSVSTYTEVPNTRTVTWHDGIREIGEHAFWNNTGLIIAAPILPANLEKLGMGAFENCTSLTGKLIVPGTLKEIPLYVFRGDTGLTGLEIQKGVTTIGGGSFYGCKNIEGTLAIPAGVVYVQEAAFKNCEKINGLSWAKRRAGAEKISLGRAAFENCKALQGDLVLDCDDVSLSQADRTFMGTGYTQIYLDGRWSKMTIRYLKGKEENGSYDSYVEDDVIDEPVATFPQNATLYYDSRLYQPDQYEGFDNEQTIREALTKLKYTFYAGSTIGHEPGYDVAEAKPDNPGLNYIAGADYGDGIELVPYAPAYANIRWVDNTLTEYSAANDAFITGYDHSIVDIKSNGEKTRIYVTPLKPGRTTYTVQVMTQQSGIHTATGTITVSDANSVHGVWLDKYSLSLNKGAKYTLKATVLPANARNKAVTWSSSDESVATVSAKGLVTAVGKGKATITVTTRENGFTETCTVTVKADSYKVRFDGNGADGGSMAAMDYDYGKTYSLPKNAFSKNGSVFDGWCTVANPDENDPGVRYADKASVTDLVEKNYAADPGITLYAQWKPDKTYTIAYDANAKKAFGSDVKGYMYDVSDLEYTDTVPVYINFYEAKGCTFAGWNTKADGTGKAVEPDTEVTLSADLGVSELAKPGVGKITLYAQWTPNTYVATFDLNDGGTHTAEFDNKTFGTRLLGTDEGLDANQAGFTFGTAVSKLPTAKRNGYAFGGWCTDSACTTLLKSIPKTQTSNLTLYAKWTPWKYTVTYDGNKNQGTPKFTVSGSTSKTTANYGEDLRISPNGFINKGYEFIGWTTVSGSATPDPNLTAAKVADGIVEWTVVQTVNGFVIDKNSASLKLYAVWKKLDHYTIDYKVVPPAIRNESDSNKYDATYVYGEGLDRALPTPVWAGYKFEGWYEDATLKKQVKQIDKKTFGNLTLYPKWSASYRVVLHDGETTPKILAGYTYNKEKALPANPFKNDNAAFMGWKLKNGDAVKYADKEKIKAPELIPNPGDNVLTLDLYAVWKSDFTYTLDLDGGVYPAGEKNKLPAGVNAYTYAQVKASAINMPKNVIKDGYKFNGLIDQATGKKITSITKTTCRDYVIKADFTPQTYQITYNANLPKGAKGGGKMATQKLTVGQPATLSPNDFYANGYTFVGWALDANALWPEYEDGDAFDFGAAGYKSKVTLYAIWAKFQ